LEAADFINKMIMRKPNYRLGVNGPDEVKNHAWLRQFPWKDLHDRKIVSPFIPQKDTDHFDEKNINEEWRDIEDEKFKEHGISLRRNSV
jgi:serine/threonine protein kinase